MNDKLIPSARRMYTQLIHTHTNTFNIIIIIII